MAIGVRLLLILSEIKLAKSDSSFMVLLFVFRVPTVFLIVCYCVVTPPRMLLLDVRCCRFGVFIPLSVGDTRSL